MSIRDLAFSPDGNILASAGNYGIVRLWQIPSGDLLHTLKPHTTHISSIEFFPDGKAILSGSDDSTIRLWNVP
ncbi:MAG TPA: hypothetical protein G4N96_06860 [Chloroflexi bacterium]|nr:hypothetical protein [Chloroflexota bacterium]